MYKGQLRSLNTGIVSSLRYQQDVTFSISQLTFAHELGHNLGSGVSYIYYCEIGYMRELAYTLIVQCRLS